MSASRVSSFGRSASSLRSSTPNRFVDATRLGYDEQATSFYRSRQSSSDCDDFAITYDTSRPFTPRINPSRNHQPRRSDDVFLQLYESGLEKKKKELEKATVDAVLEVEKLWAPFRSNSDRNGLRPPWNSALSNVESTHAPRSTVPSRSPWTKKAAILAKEEAHASAVRLRRSNSCPPPAAASLQTSTSKLKQRGCNETNTSHAEVRGTSPMRDPHTVKISMHRIEELSKPRRGVARPVLDQRASNRSVERSSARVARPASGGDTLNSTKNSNVNHTPVHVDTEDAFAVRDNGPKAVSPDLTAPLPHAEPKAAPLQLPRASTNNASPAGAEALAAREVSAAGSPADASAKRREVLQKLRIDSDDDSDDNPRKAPHSPEPSTVFSLVEQNEEVKVNGGVSGQSTPPPEAPAAATPTPVDSTPSTRLSAIMRQLEAV